MGRAFIKAQQHEDDACNGEEKVKKHSFQCGVPTPEITSPLQALILGFLLGELCYLSQAIASAFNAYIQTFNKGFVFRILRRPLT